VQSNTCTFGVSLDSRLQKQHWTLSWGGTILAEEGREGNKGKANSKWHAFGPHGCHTTAPLDSTNCYAMH
jgi:hypothetical protein